MRKSRVPRKKKKRSKKAVKKAVEQMVECAFLALSVSSKLKECANILRIVVSAKK